MKKFHQHSTDALSKLNLINSEQLENIKAYRSKQLFSLYNELQILLYLGIVLFTTGTGVLVYKNIDSIGHSVIVTVLGFIIVLCFYFCFKKSNGFQKTQTKFDNPVYDYLVLLGNILFYTLIGYLHFQYAIFGENYGSATLIPTIFAFTMAYYFDNKMVLSIAITGLTAWVGLTVNLLDVLNGSIYDNKNFTYFAILLSVLFSVWHIYFKKINLKIHFDIVFITYALHLISLACLANFFDDYWFIYGTFLSLASYYFFKISISLHAISIFIFVIIYSYIGFNIFAIRFFDTITFGVIWEVLVIFLPFYFLGSIFLFVKMIKNFNKNKL